jgi:hypothetical protein
VSIYDKKSSGQRYHIAIDGEFTIRYEMSDTGASSVPLFPIHFNESVLVTSDGGSGYQQYSVQVVLE